MRAYVIGAISTSALVAAGICAPARAEPDASTIIEPLGQWVLDYADDRCRLARIFGTDDEKTVFWIEQNGPSPSFSWLVAGGAVNRLRYTSDVTATFGPGFEPFEIDPVLPTPRTQQDFKLEGFGRAVQSHGYRRSDPAPQPAEGTSDSFRLNPLDGARIDFIELRRKGRSVRLNTGNLAEGFEAMNTCTANLYEFWGVAPDFGANLVEPAKPKNPAVVAHKIQRRYPRTAERLGHDAILTLKALVGADGRVEKCITIKKTKADSFDESACELFQKFAEFEPARDANGNPMSSFYTTTVLYYAD